MIGKKSEVSGRFIFLYLLSSAIFILLIFVVRDNAVEEALKHQGYQDMIRSYERLDPPEVRDKVFWFMELLSSESYKQADPGVQKEAAMTFEAFLLQFGPALDEAKKTGDTNHLGLLRAMMSGDKDAEILYRRELGLIKVKPYSGD